MTLHTKSTAFLAIVTSAHLVVASFILLKKRKSNNDEGDDEGVLLPPRTVAEFEATASKMPHMTRASTSYIGYYDGLGHIGRDARKVFASIRLVPQILTGDLTGVDTSTTLFGDKLSMPVLVAPTAGHSMCCIEEGEVATARGCGEAGVGYCFNWMASSRTYVDVKEESGVKWLSLYMYDDRTVIEKVIKYAEQLGGFTAITLTCDHPHDRVVNNMTPIWASEPIPDEELDKPVFPNMALVSSDFAVTMRQMFEAQASNNAEEDSPMWSKKLSWDNVRHVKSLTKLPVVVKGVLSPSDALKAMEVGADGIIVSNHGGRQFDGAPPAIECLPSVVAAVKGKIPVFVDTGVRMSSDVIKALCLGASAVLMGRPPLWALACGGADALKRMFDTLRNDVECDMKSLGVRSVSDLGPDFIWPPDRKRIESDSMITLGPKAKSPVVPASTMRT